MPIAPQTPPPPPCSFAHKTTAPVVGEKKDLKRPSDASFTAGIQLIFPRSGLRGFRKVYFRLPSLGWSIGSGGSNRSDIFLPFLKVFPSSHVGLRFLGFRFLQSPGYHYYRLQCLALHFPFSWEVLSVNSRLLI